MRKSEVSFLRWDELDLAGGWANLPASRMKNGRDFRAPLSASAKALIESMPKTSDLVFTTNGKTPISGWGHAKPRLDELMAAELGQPVTEWHLHDLRRTVASGIARLGFPTEVIKRVLAHVPNASDVTSQVYNWFMYDDQAKAAVQAWAAHIAKVTTGLEVVESVG
jgi:integrase